MPKSRKRKYVAKKPVTGTPVQAPRRETVREEGARPVTPAPQPAVKKPFAPRAATPLQAQYPYVRQDLLRVCVVTGIVVAVLVIFALVLS